MREGAPLSGLQLPHPPTIEYVPACAGAAVKGVIMPGRQSRSPPATPAAREETLSFPRLAARGE
jgi:hypothetical protein